MQTPRQAAWHVRLPQVFQWRYSKLHRPIRASTGQHPSVGGVVPRSRLHSAGVALQAGHGLPGVGLPEPHVPAQPLATSRP